MRHVEHVLALVLEQEVVAGDAGHGPGRDAVEAPDAVVLVHHVVALAQVEEGRQRGAADEALLAGGAAQQRALGNDGQLELGREEALAERRRHEVQARRRLAVPLQLLRADDLRA